DFHYNPKLFWDVSNDKDAVMLKPGPNSPVGVVWIDLNKPHYGIHGTSEPHTIGRAESHGCVRLTNWDAARVAQMVKSGTPAIFRSEGECDPGRSAVPSASSRRRPGSRRCVSIHGRDPGLRRDDH